jgi:hypothetical protein
MMWCTIGLFGSLLASQDPPQPPAPQSGFEIVEVNPGKAPKKSEAKSQRVSTKRTGKPLEIKMPKQKRGATKLQKPKKRG